MTNILRDSVKDLHDALEATPFAIRMFEGKLTVAERKAYYASQQPIFEYLDRHVCSTYLERAPIFQHDINALAGSPATRPIATHTYVSHLKNRAKTLDPHHYVNYMGLLFGGQIMKKMYPQTTIYEFPRPIVQCRELIRNQHCHTINSEFIEEARQGFQFQINIFTELGVLHHVG